LGYSHLSEIQLLPSLFQWFRFLRSRVWNVWCIRNAGSSLSSNRSGSCDQELGMLDLSEMQFHCLPTDSILAIKSLECSDLSEIQPI
jgi:hypothetical protein